jgi:hypothetical protein
MLYWLTDGANWTDNTNWITGEFASDWFGVTVAGGRVTGISLGVNNLSGDITDWVMPTAIELLTLGNNPITGDLSGWTLAPTMETLALGNTPGFTGDVSSWWTYGLPSGLIYFGLNGTNLSGDVSNMVMPSGLEKLFMYFANFTGSVTNWVLPFTLDTLYIGWSSLTGDVSNWVIPAPISLLFLNNTGISGDISNWVIPSLAWYVWLNDSGIYGAPDLSGASTLVNLAYQNCGLSQAQVDAVLQEIYNERAVFPAAPALNIAGTNSTPSGIYQDGDPPTTGKEYAYEVENDPESEGFNTWSITYA